jgi:hypothetical protein
VNRAVVYIRSIGIEWQEVQAKTASGTVAAIALSRGWCMTCSTAGEARIGGGSP